MKFFGPILVIAFAFVVVALGGGHHADTPDTATARYQHQIQWTGGPR